MLLYYDRAICCLVVLCMLGLTCVPAMNGNREMNKHYVTMCMPVSIIYGKKSTLIAHAAGCEPRPTFCDPKPHHKSPTLNTTEHGNYAFRIDSAMSPK